MSSVAGSRAWLWLGSEGLILLRSAAKRLRAWGEVSRSARDLSTVPWAGVPLGPLRTRRCACRANKPTRDHSLGSGREEMRRTPWNFPGPVTSATVSWRAYAGLLANSAASFIAEDHKSIFSALVTQDEGFSRVWRSAIEVWNEEVPWLQSTISAATTMDGGVRHWGILLEFPIPRRQKRIDVVLLAKDVIIVLELKTTIDGSSALTQAEDYALDLASFHAMSSAATIIPVVVAGGTRAMPPEEVSDSLVLRPGRCGREQLASYIVELCLKHSSSGLQIDWRQWNNAAYRPVPTMIDAARAIFSGMEVREIAHAQSDPHNLTTTVDCLVSIVQAAIKNNEKAICFVTGVPGSGKTLAGLRAVHDDRLRQLTGSDPAFFSGNGPLVKILRESLIRDAARRGEKKADAGRRITAMVQNVHQLARTCFDDPEKRPPNERVMVFDEAQRAWNAEQNKRKFKRNISEPEMIINIMNRHDHWAVIVCLVGGGQEIHDGEAGLREWGDALQRRFLDWKVYASREAIDGGPAVAGSRLVTDRGDLHIVEVPELHLSVATRTYPRAQVLNDWCNSVLAGDVAVAKSLATSTQFPVYVTRELATAKAWLRQNTRGFDRCGLVASSGAARLRAHGLETATSFHRDYPYELWFLNPKGDVRSSFQLEVLATEFEIQGLELDHVCLCWGGDFTWSDKRRIWEYSNFVGTKWRRVPEESAAREFIRNKYRVLVTRARQSVIIWVPRGDASDLTIAPEPFDDTAEMLTEAGARPLHAGATERTDA